MGEARRRPRRGFSRDCVCMWLIAKLRTLNCGKVYVYVYVYARNTMLNLLRGFLWSCCRFNGGGGGGGVAVSRLKSYCVYIYVVGFLGKTNRMDSWNYMCMHNDVYRT